MLIVTYYLVYFNYFLILFLCLVFRLTFIQKKCKINTVGPEYDLSGLGATIVIEDKFSSFPVRVFLLKGEVDEETAAEDACRIEHVISDKSFSAVKAHFLNYKNK